MSNSRNLTAIAIAGLIVVAVVVGVIAYYSLRIKGSGKIKAVGVKAYSDPAATLEVSAIDWGTIPPGGLSQATLYLKSTSSVPANLTLSTEGWEPPSSENYMTLSWDLDTPTFQPGEIRAVILTLKVSESITGIIDFSFTVVITAAG